MRWAKAGSWVVGVLVLGCAAERRPAVDADATRLIPGLQATSDVVPEPVPLASATWVLTTREAPFTRSVLASTRANGAADVEVDEQRTAQPIDGFGGAFNEKGWEALLLLDEPKRKAVLTALFDETNGLGFNHCRLPIGASDYAVSRYTLDETPGDYAMARFSIARDQERLIPYVRAALAVRPDLKLWGSAWTPPTWMKTNRAFDGGAMRDEPRIYAAYALYLLKYVEAYRALGIDVSMVVPQNEPGQLTHYPSADWKPAQYITFIRDHLGPLLKERSPRTSVFAGTINAADWDLTSVLRDPGAAAHIAGVALQWGGLAQLPAVHATFPDLYIMQSETECGNRHWEPGFNPERPPNDFAYAAYTWRKFQEFLGGGASSYMLWNMVLDEQGKSIDSVQPWPQNAAIIVDRATRKPVYTPMYWATRHFSGLIQRGARLVAASGSYRDRIAFLNPDRTVVVELLNDQEKPTVVSVQVRGRVHAVDVAAESFGTLIVPP